MDVLPDLRRRILREDAGVIEKADDKPLEQAIKSSRRRGSGVPRRDDRGDRARRQHPGSLPHAAEAGGTPARDASNPQGASGTSARRFSSAIVARSSAGASAMAERRRMASYCRRREAGRVKGAYPVGRAACATAQPTSSAGHGAPGAGANQRRLPSGTRRRARVEGRREAPEWRLAPPETVGSPPNGMCPRHERRLGDSPFGGRLGRRGCSHPDAIDSPPRRRIFQLRPTTTGVVPSVGRGRSWVCAAVRDAWRTLAPQNVAHALSIWFLS